MHSGSVAFSKQKFWQNNVFWFFISPERSTGATVVVMPGIIDQTLWGSLNKLPVHSSASAVVQRGTESTSWREHQPRIKKIVHFGCFHPVLTESFLPPLSSFSLLKHTLLTLRSDNSITKEELPFCSTIVLQNPTLTFSGNIFSLHAHQPDTHILPFYHDTLFPALALNFDSRHKSWDKEPSSIDVLLTEKP